MFQGLIRCSVYRNIIDLLAKHFFYPDHSLLLLIKEFNNRSKVKILDNKSD